MKPQSPRPARSAGREGALSSRDTSASPAHADRNEVTKQLGLAMKAVARTPASREQTAGDRPAELIDAAQEEALQIQDTLVAARVHARAHAAVEAATRIANGTYGICQACGQPIPPRRLQAVPLTPFCLPCQEARDRGSRGRYRLDEGA